MSSHGHLPFGQSNHTSSQNCRFLINADSLEHTSVCGNIQFSFHKNLKVESQPLCEEMIQRYSRN